MNVLSYGINIWTDLSSILSGITRVTDRRTDGQTEFSSLDRVCISWIKLPRWSEIADFYRAALSKISDTKGRPHQLLANVNSCSCSLYVVVRPSVCRLSVVCNVRAPYSGD